MRVTSGTRRVRWCERPSDLARHRASRPSGTAGFLRVADTSLKVGGGRGCPVGGSIQTEPVERALVLYCADAMRLAGSGSDSAQRTLRAELAEYRRRIVADESALARLTDVLAQDAGTPPAAVLQRMRALESALLDTRAQLEIRERDLADVATPAAPDLAQRWLALYHGIESHDYAARLEARELVRATYSRITLWHAGLTPDKTTFAMELTTRAGATVRMVFDRASGGLVGVG